MWKKMEINKNRAEGQKSEASIERGDCVWKTQNIC